MADDPKFPYDQPDYRHDLELAMLARAVYAPKEDIAYLMMGAYEPSSNKSTLPLNWSLLGQDDMGNPDNFQDDNARTGFVAAAFEGPDKHIVIAFRGTDNDKDWFDFKNKKAGPNVALAADGDLLKELGLPVRGETPHAQAAAVQSAVLPDWHRQFQQALEYVNEIQMKYPGYSIEVTGHSLGGSLAQLTSHTFGLDGRAFDPAGAHNILESQEYKAWCKANGIERNEAARELGLPMHEPNFVNYLVNDSLISQKSGKHIYDAHNIAVTALGGREGTEAYTSYALGKAGAVISDVLDMVPPIPGIQVPKTVVTGSRGADLYLKVLTESDTLGRHDMDRIVHVFERAVEKGKLQQWGQTQRDAPVEAQQVVMTPSHGVSGRTGKPDLPDHDHPDYALFSALKERLPREMSDEMVGHVMLQAKMGGVRAEQLDKVAIVGDHAFVAGKTPGDRAKVDVSVAPPPMTETVRQSEAFDQQRAQQLSQLRDQQPQVNEQNTGPKMTM